MRILVRMPDSDLVHETWWAGGFGGRLECGRLFDWPGDKPATRRLTTSEATLLAGDEEVSCMGCVVKKRDETLGNDEIVWSEERI